jgi:hypothetical protein
MVILLHSKTQIELRKNKIGQEKKDKKNAP